MTVSLNVCEWENILSQTLVIGKCEYLGHTESCLLSAHDSMRLCWPPLWWVNSTGWWRKKRSRRRRKKGVGWKTRQGGNLNELIEWTKDVSRIQNMKQPWLSLPRGGWGKEKHDRQKAGSMVKTQWGRNRPKAKKCMSVYVSQVRSGLCACVW